MAESPPDVEALDLDGLRLLVLQLLESVASLKAENAALREEIARLKGLKGPPKLKPSGMETARAAKPAGVASKRRRRGKTLTKLAVTEERTLRVAVPPGSRFKGYESYVVQDLVLRARVIRFRRARWLTPAGKTILAPLRPSARQPSGKCRS